MGTPRQAGDAAWVDLLVDHRLLFLTLVILSSIGMALLAIGLKVDRSPDALADQTSPAYAAYRDFMGSFGSDDVVIVALSNQLTAGDPRIISALAGLTRELERNQGIDSVVSLTNLHLPFSTSGATKAVPLAREGGRDRGLDLKGLERARGFWPGVNLLVSRDLLSLGLIVRLRGEGREPSKSGEVLESIVRGLRRHFPPESVYHLSGRPVLTEAFYVYNLRTTVIFAGLASIVGASLLVLIFGSWWLPLIVYPISGLAAVWGAGLLAALGARLNALSGLCFGFVFVVTTATVVHLVTAYQNACHDHGTSPETVKRALSRVGRPCLMCALTTAAGFASITLSRLEAVRQFGLVMTLATLLAFVLTLALAPTFLMRLHPRSATCQGGWDRFSSAVAAIGGLAFRGPVACLTVGLIVTGMALAGIPRIATDMRMLSMFREESPEVRAAGFIEQNLAPLGSLEVMVTGDKEAFLREDAWRGVRAFEERAAGLEGVAAVDSILPLLTHLLESGAFPAGPGPDDRPVPADVLEMMKSHPEAREFMGNYLTGQFSRLRISLRIPQAALGDLPALLHQVRGIAATELGRLGEVVVTGSLSFFETQFRTLVATQIRSLLLALILIVLLMALQFRSLLLGMLCLIPNLVPPAVVFGLMGWAGIPLTGMSVLTAAIAIGLSADDTIHYVSAFRGALRGECRGDAPAALKAAYRATGKALFSTTLILAASLLVLAFAPLKPSVAFGILIAAAAIAAWAGDVLLMPALILGSRGIRRTLEGRFSPQAAT